MTTTDTTLDGWVIARDWDTMFAAVRPLTPVEEARVGAFLARHGGDPVTALGVDVPEDVAAAMRRFATGQVSR